MAVVRLLDKLPPPCQELLGYPEALRTPGTAWERGDSAQLVGSLVRLENLERLGSAPLNLAVRRQILGL